MDTGANKNYLAPKFVDKKYRKPVIQHQVKNINGSFKISEYVEWNAFESLLRDQKLPKQIFYIFKFHEFFDGLIGYETMRTLNAVIDTGRNSLIIHNREIAMQKKCSQKTECHFQETVLNKSLRTPLESGDFFIERDIEIAPCIKIPSGVYRAENNQAI